jgi:ribosomal protein S14
MSDKINESQINLIPLEELELSLDELNELEELSKSCPRCGGKSANPSNPSGRCRSCLNKLAHAKKTPGSAFVSSSILISSIR